MFRKFFTNPGFLVLVAICAFGGLRSVLPPPVMDDGVRFVQANIGDKHQLVRVNANAKMVHYHGNLRWDDVNRDLFAIYEKDGKLTTFAMQVDRPWKFREPTADEAALWSSFFRS